MVPCFRSLFQSLFIGIFLFLNGTVLLLVAQSSDAEKLDEGSCFPEIILLDSLNPLTERFAHIPESYNAFRGVAMVESECVAYYSLLPYIFFDSASDALPERYRVMDSYEETFLFNESRISGDAVQKYYHLLNIIGSRLRNVPNARIGILGNNSAQPEIGETLVLSEVRAQAVYRYLKEIWRIPEEQLLLLPPQNLPSWPGNWRTHAGAEANRRVELYLLDSLNRPIPYQSLSTTDDHQLLRPVVDSSTRPLCFPAAASLELRYSLADSLIAYSLIEIRRNGVLWNQLIDSTKTSRKIFYNWINAEGKFPDRENALFTFSLVVRTHNGTEYRSQEEAIPVLYISKEKARAEFRANPTVIAGHVLSGINAESAGRMGKMGLFAIQNYFCPFIKAASIVDIIGTANNLSRADRSLKLAESLSGETAYYIRESSPEHSNPVHTYPLGQWFPSFDNILPEGRFYNEGVQLVVCLGKE